MNSTLIDCFLATADTGSFSKAAAKLFLTQQTVSKHVAKLEYELRTKLFERTGNSLRLTPAGRYYLNILGHCAYNSYLMKNKMNAYYEERNRGVRILCSEWINPNHYIIRCIKNFQSISNNINFSLLIYDNDSLLNQMENFEADIVLVSEGCRPESDLYDTRKICAEQLALIGPDYTIGHNLPKEQRALRKELPLLTTPRHREWYMETQIYIQRQRESLDIPLQRTRSAPNPCTQKEMLRNIPCLAITDLRFGWVQPESGLASEPLGKDSWLCAMIPYQTENPWIYKFTDYLTAELAKIFP